jgi:hypothetical protein
MLADTFYRIVFKRRKKMNEWLPYAMMAGGQLIGNLGSSDAKQVGTAQAPGDAWLQGMIQPGMAQSLANLYQGGSAYPVPQAPTPNYQISPYATPQAQYQSPADFAGGYTDILNKMIEPYGESLGTGMGGWSGGGQNVLGSAMGQIAPQIMNQYTQYQLPYQQMAMQGAGDVFNAQNQQGQLGYQGQLQGYGYQNAAMNPYNYYGMYQGSTGSPMVQPSQQDPWAQALQTGMMMYGMNSMSPFGSASAGAGASGIGAGYGVGGAVGAYGTGAAASTYGTGAGLGSYAAGMEGAGAGSSIGAGAGGTGAVAGGIGAAALNLYGAYNTYKNWGVENAPGGVNYIQSYLKGSPAGSDVSGFKGVMPGQDWWNNPYNVASMLSAGDLSFDQNNPLVKMVQNREVTYEQLGALMNQYAQHREPGG